MTHLNLQVITITTVFSNAKWNDVDSLRQLFLSHIVSSHCGIEWPSNVLWRSTQMPNTLLGATSQRWVIIVTWKYNWVYVDNRQTGRQQHRFGIGWFWGAWFLESVVHKQWVACSPVGGDTRSHSMINHTIYAMFLSSCAMLRWLWFPPSIVWRGRGSTRARMLWACFFDCSSNQP